MATAQAQTITAGGIPVQVHMWGDGQPCLLLHSEIGLASHDRFLAILGRERRVILPIHPGFQASETVVGVETVDDLAYLYLDLVKELGLRDLDIVGLSLGAWIAAEMAVRSTERMAKLVLANAFGIKISDRETRDIVDIFGVSEEELAKRAYCDVALSHNNYKQLADSEIMTIARNREAAAFYGWSPYMHNPKLKGRLHRIDIPALVLWGAQNRIVAPDYGRSFAQAIPGAQFEIIDRAGHYPQIERPEAFAEKILDFTGGAGRSRAGSRAQATTGAVP